MSPREFYRFQRKWDELNERLGFRMSGPLWLMTEDHKTDPTWPRELYRFGIRVSGDSIGRPNRHSLAVARHKREKQQQADGKMPDGGDSA